MVFTLALFSILMPVAQAPDPEDYDVEGDISLKVYSDGYVEAGVTVSYEGAIEPWTYQIYTDIFLELASSPAGENLTEIASTFVMKLNPEYAGQIADLDLDVRVHTEDWSTEATILVRWPGTFGVEGRVEFIPEEALAEGTLDVELTLELWYAIYPSQYIEQMVELFPMMQAQLATMVSESTEGALEIEELELVASEIGTESATLSIAVTIAGDFQKAFQAISEVISQFSGSVPPTVPEFEIEDYIVTKVRSADMALTFYKEELAFNLGAESVIEGDIDGQFNLIKNLILEQLIQLYGMDSEDAEIIDDFLLPTEISVENLEATFEYSVQDGTLTVDLTVSGFGLRPPTAEALLGVLQDGSEVISETTITLTIEGATEDDFYVEISVPETTTQPTLTEPQKVVWAFEDIENLDQVTFEVKEIEEEGQSAITPQIIIPVAGGVIAVVAAAAFMLARRK
ncbi:MAG: hypothetical protein JSV18_05790 [Candidatus Bathyarchaeota archaeon]|nr:MAG: hypothetical protein JSV18_05790 [Candidatus Bathyarchaeota archaeon]